LSALFRGRKATKEELIRKVAEDLAADASRNAKLFSDIFGHTPLADGQTLDRAMAEWQAIMVSGTVYALWASVGSAEKIFPILDAFKPAFLARLSPGCREAFMGIANSREDFYVKSFSDVLTSKDDANAVNLSGAMARRVTGHYNDEIERAGPLGNDGPDVFDRLLLWKDLTTHIIATKQYFDELQRRVPTLF